MISLLSVTITISICSLSQLAEPLNSSLHILEQDSLSENYNATKNKSDPSTCNAHCPKTYSPSLTSFALTLDALNLPSSKSSQVISKIRNENEIYFQSSLLFFLNFQFLGACIVLSLILSSQDTAQKIKNSFLCMKMSAIYLFRFKNQFCNHSKRSTGTRILSILFSVSVAPAKSQHASH